jgi:hypothetical protein
MMNVFVIFTVRELLKGDHSKHEGREKCVHNFSPRWGQS